MKKRSFRWVEETHEDHVTLVPFCPDVNAEITATFHGPFEVDEELFMTEAMPIKQAIEAAQRRAKLKSCEVVILDPQKLWDPAHGELV